MGVFNAIGTMFYQALVVLSCTKASMHRLSKLLAQSSLLLFSGQG